jgi:hypothetical protein
VNHEFRTNVLDASGRVCCSGDPKNFCTMCKEALRDHLPQHVPQHDPKLPDAWAALLQQHDTTDQLRAMALARQSFYETFFAPQALTPATSSVHLEPPDGWLEAVKKQKEAR